MLNVTGIKTMTILDDCTKFFGTHNLYQVLGLSDRSASVSRIKKAYYKLSLVCHPDRTDNSNDKSHSTQKFQVLSRVYSILSDTDKRAVYDETGLVDDEDVVSGGQDWYAFWRQLFKPVTVADIKSYREKYQASEEEATDIQREYQSRNGDVEKVFDSIPFCDSEEDEQRVRQLINDWIKDGILEPSDGHVTRGMDKKDAAKAVARRKRAEKEAVEAEEHLEKLTGKKDASLSDLEEMIKQRQGARTGFLDQLEAKYSSTASSGSRKRKAK